MNFLSLCAAGYVGKVQGLTTVKGVPTYRFSLGVNFNNPANDTLWLQCSIIDPLLNIVLERGVLPGDYLMVQIDHAVINALIDGNRAKSWLNCKVHQIVFLVAPDRPQLERAAGFEPRELPTVIDYNQLFKQRVG